MWAIIGGSGFEKFDGFKILERLDTKTPFGNTSSGLALAELNGQQFIFLSRHGNSHEILPSQINHKANIFALKKNNVKAILSFSAVGSLREDLKPGDLVIPDQYIDRTKKLLNQTTFFGDEALGKLVGHMSMGEPIDLRIFPILKRILKSKDFKIHFEKTYICMEGPNFSTRAESKMYQSWGADIIGMTNFPEYALAKEANLLYLPFCFVTDYDSWRLEETPVTLDEVLVLMKKNNSKAFSLINEILIDRDLKSIYNKYQSGFPLGVMTNLDHLTVEQKEYLQNLF